MRSLRPTYLILALCVVLAGLTSPVQAAWVWSPDTGWVGPWGVVKDYPDEQLAYALSFFDQGDYDRAKVEFEKLLRAYEDAIEAPEAQYYLGRCEEEEGDYYKAFLEYRKTIEVYPSTKRFEEILEREYQIANLFLGGTKRKLFGTAALLPARDKAAEIFQAVAEDGPFTEHGQLAQYKLGLTYLELQQFEEAVAAFEQIISRYPESPLVDDARYQIALASLKGTFRPGYDQAPTDRAIRELESFTRTYATSDLEGEAASRLEELYERRAEHEYQVAQFYEDREQPASALVYYRAIIDDYVHTSWAPRAAERIEVLTTEHPSL